MPQLQTILSQSASIGFMVVGIAATAGWFRRRDQINARLAAALGLLGATAVIDDVNSLSVHSTRVVPLLALFAFLGSGGALLALRAVFLPLKPATQTLATVVLGGSALLCVGATLTARAGVHPPTALQIVAGLLAITAWAVCVTEPAIRFWLASRGKPAVQRARLRALSIGFLGIVTVLAVAIVAGTAGAGAGSSVQIGVELITLAVIPLLYVSFSPPRWLRRLWRDPEERAFQGATDALLLYSPNQETVAHRGLGWAVRLVGAESGALVADDGSVIALEQITAAELASVLAERDRPTRARKGDGSHSGRHVISIHLPVSGGSLTMLVVAGRFSPLFGSDEIGRLEQYAASMTLALDRVRLEAEVSRRRAQLEAVMQAINDMGEGLLVKQNGDVVFSNDAYRAIAGQGQLGGSNGSANGAGAPDITQALHESGSPLPGGGVLREGELLTPEGHLIHVETAVRTLGDNSGTMSIAMIRDITERKRAERALADQARLLDLAHDAIYVRGLDGVITYWSRGAERAYGYSAADAVGQRAFELLRTGFPRPLQEIEHEVLTVGEWEGELVHRRRDGTVCMMASRWALTRDGQGRAEGILEVNRDVTDRHRAETIRAVQLAAGRALSQSSSVDEAADSILAAIGASLEWHVAEMWLVDPTGESLTLRHWWHAPEVDAAVFAHAARRLALHRGQDIAGRVWESGQPVRVADMVNDPACQRRGIAAVLGLHGAAGFPIAVNQRVIGAVTLFSQRVRELDDDLFVPLVDAGRQLGNFLERKRTETALEETVERLEQLAATDPLTGLNNRRAFERALTAVPAEPFAVLAIDVDNLKPINDEFGHEAGDVVLQAVAMALASLVRDRDLVARVGGDEFAVLLPGVKGAEAASIAERMRTSMHAISVPYGRARISVGWTAAPTGAEARAVWRATDELLYQAKSGGRDRVEGEDFQSRSRPSTPGVNEAELLSTVLSEEQIGAVFQPIVDLDTGAIIGYEALARPIGHEATASVEALFAAARRLGRIRDLDWLCRRAAVRAARTLPGAPALFINVSAVAFLDPVHPVDQLLLLLRWAGWRPERTVLEITEQEAVRDLARVRLVVAAYREHGVRFAIDDVGEGHSTLELLAATNPEFVKIAGSLTAALEDSGRYSAIQAAMAFARSSRAGVIAEGIETEEMAARVRDLGIPLGQGYALGRPAPAEQWRQARPVRPRRRRTDQALPPPPPPPAAA